MTLKKLSAGSGYDYLIRQVAAFDSTELGTTALADYYSAKGEAPGRWTGAGLIGLEGIGAGDVVTAEQMQRLFGTGAYPMSGRALGRAYRPDAVAGFDLTFSPVKSVSVLWALAPRETAAEIEAAHAAAITDALTFIETHALFTREGTNGVRQVETRGLIGAAFTHRDSRAGDPDLHTHVAVANKVQTLGGKWLSIYGTVLHEHVVAASETYNTALEHHLSNRLGLRFAERATVAGKRPVREVEGIDPALCDLWSRRRADIVNRRAELVEEFRERHGRVPTEIELVKLAQQANLETREAKHEPRSYAEQRASWRTEAESLLGSDGIEEMLRHAARRVFAPLLPEAVDVDAAADRVIAALESHRATWQSWHVYAEAQRQLRGLAGISGEQSVMVEQVVAAVQAQTVNLTPDLDPVTEPAVLRRSDGTSVYRHTGADHYTSERILAAEERILDAAGTTSDIVVDPIDVELALMGAEASTGVRLSAGQRALVQAMASDPRQVALALAPAGTGKTTAMTTLAAVWSDLGHDVIGYAPSAAAAAVLGEAAGIPTDTLAKLDDLIAHGRPTGLRPGAMVIIDEAGMGDTTMLDRVIAHCAEQGAVVRLVGDDQQLTAVGAGGVLRDIATRHGATRLDEVVRFADPVEGKAGLALREGDASALGFYLDHDRLHTGDTDTCLDDVLTAWTEERREGRDCVMLAPTRALVADLNARARATRLAGTKPPQEVVLRDGNAASIGDTILTRHNDRRLRITATDWVKNGDRWTVTGVGRDGSLTAQNATTGLRVTLPAGYVREHTELGYASTVHTTQGLTADVMHGIVTGTEDRQLLYTMLTRGRAENHLHLIVEPAEEADQFLPGIDEQLTAVDALDRIVARDGTAVSATTARSRTVDPTTQLHEAVQRYADAVLLAAKRVLGAEVAETFESAGGGPLPWLPAVPDDVRETGWGDYLTARAERVEQLTTQVCEHGELSQRVADRVPAKLREHVLLWRAATGVTDDHTVLGTPPADPAAARYARYLHRGIEEALPSSVRRWNARIAAVVPGDDERAVDLARELDRLHRRGVNAGMLLRRAAAKPLPTDHAVDALAYRIERLVKHSAGWDDPIQRREPTRDRGLGL